MPEVTQQQVVEYIKGISVLELSQLVKTLEAELGVSAASAMPAAAPAGGAGGAAAAPVEEKTEFNVILTEIGTAKINGCNPEAYLRDVLTRIADHSITRIAELLPWNFKPAAEQTKAA